MKKYPSQKIVISDLNEIQQETLSTDVYFEYKSVNFFYKKNTKQKNLLVGFHGSLTLDSNTKIVKPSLPVFRFFDYRMGKCNILCISDKNLERYSDAKLIVSWYLSCGDSEYEQTYKEIIDHFAKTHQEIIFSGSSGGGFPALKFGCMFNQTVLIQNSQIYLSNHVYYKTLLEKIWPNLPSGNNIESYFGMYGSPKYARILQNIRDINHFKHHFIPFKNFIISRGLEQRFSFEEFDNSSPKLGPHNVVLPKNITHQYLINETFQRLGV